MTIWLYTGKSASGKDIVGEINAPNKDEAKILLRKKRILVQKFKKKPMAMSFNLLKGVPVRDLARFTRQFSAMNSAGLPLIQCLDTLAEQEENKVLKNVKIDDKVHKKMKLFCILNEMNFQHFVEDSIIHFINVVNQKKKNNKKKK